MDSPISQRPVTPAAGFSPEKVVDCRFLIETSAAAYRVVVNVNQGCLPRQAETGIRVSGTL